MCHEIFDPHFFHDLNPFWPGYNFEFGFNFDDIFDHEVRNFRLRGMNDTELLGFVNSLTFVKPNISSTMLDVFNHTNNFS